MLRSTEKILGDVQKIMAGLEVLIDETVSRTEERLEGAAGRIDDATEHLHSKLEEARERLADIEHEMAGGVKSAARTAGEIASENPWASLATVAAVAFLAGIVVSPRKPLSGACSAARRGGSIGVPSDQWLDGSG